MAKVDILKRSAEMWGVSSFGARKALREECEEEARRAWERFAAAAIERITTPRGDEPTEGETDAIVDRISMLAELAEIAWRARWTVEVEDEGAS